MINIIIFIFFFPASLGLGWQIFHQSELSSQLIALAFFCFCLEQARMAVLDLKLYQQTQSVYQDSRLVQFKLVLIITISVELTGFYTASWQLGLGAIIVLLSQVLFNCFAGIKFNQGEQITIESVTFAEKKLELLADFSGILFMSLWAVNFYSLVIAIAMLIIILIYALVKLANLWQD